ncbi:14-3-3 protein-domain-containing protein [Lactifluus subvellereus]|nr:14-3-3 protein-domain-containing protein [Lactifluus subvellereus]
MARTFIKVAQLWTPTLRFSLSSLSLDAYLSPCLPCAWSTSLRSHSPHLQQVNTKTSRADCLALAKLAEQAERWDDVIKQLKSIISYSDAHLTMEERNLLSIAYKHVTGTLRSSWRTVEGIEKQETTSARATEREQALIRHQREKIELELADACKDLLNLLDHHLVPAAEAGEERVFYYKMHVYHCFVVVYCSL